MNHGLRIESISHAQARVQMHAPWNLQLVAGSIQPRNSHAADEIGKTGDLPRQRIGRFQIDIVQLVLILHVARFIIKAKSISEGKCPRDSGGILSEKAP